jgi:hypothetical protein
VDIIRNARGGKQPSLDPPCLSSLYHWVQSHETLSLRKVTNMEVDRIRSSTKEHINPFFDMLEILQNKRHYRMELKVFFITEIIFMILTVSIKV